MGLRKSVAVILTLCALTSAMLAAPSTVSADPPMSGTDGGGEYYGEWYVYDDPADGNRYRVRKVYNEKGEQTGEERALVGPTPSNGGPPSGSPPGSGGGSGQPSGSNGGSGGSGGEPENPC